MDLQEAHTRLSTLRHRLTEICNTDPTQEVGGLALVVIDAIVRAARPLMKPGDEIGAAIRDLINPDEPPAADQFPSLPAASALIVVEQLYHSLEPLPYQPIDLGVSSPFADIWDKEW